MKHISVIIFIICLFIGSALAFSNSLDGSEPRNSLQNLQNQGQTPKYQSSQNVPYNPKEYTGFPHQDRQFPEQSMNDARYNSNCQFGSCVPGGLNKSRN